MVTTIKSYLSPPVFQDSPEDSYLARIIQWVTLASLAFLLFAMLLVASLGLLRRTLGAYAAYQAMIIIALGFVPLLVAIWVLRQRHLTVAGVLVAFTVGSVTMVVVYRAGGVARPALFVDLFALVVTGLLFRRSGIFISALLLSLGTAAILVFDARLPRPGLPPAPAFNYFVLNVFLLITVSFLLEFSNRNLFTTLKRTLANEKELEVKNRTLQSITQDLEAIVEERTAELRQVNSYNEKRASQLSAVTDVARSIANVQDLRQLLPQVASVISRRFGYYHAGIFLLDDRAEYAVLRAASSEGGMRMLNHNHQLRVGSQGIVGHVAQSAEARIAADVGADAVFFNNPDLPDTHSEMALPLLVSGRVIGVLDVQSDKPSAFSTEDQEILSALAGHVAIAIENARLFTQTRQALAEVERTTRQATRLEWEHFADQAQTIGYRYTGQASEALSAAEKIPEFQQAAMSGESATSPQTLAIPIKLRGQTIGVLGLKARSPDRQWEENDIVVAQAAADRVALALENARLLEGAQRRAAKEQAIGDISARINSSTNVGEILKTAARELGLMMGDADVLVQFREVPRE